MSAIVSRCNSSSSRFYRRRTLLPNTTSTVGISDTTRTTTTTATTILFSNTRNGYCNDCYTIKFILQQKQPKQQESMYCSNSKYYDAVAYIRFNNRIQQQQLRTLQKQQLLQYQYQLYYTRRRINDIIKRHNSLLQQLYHHHHPQQQQQQLQHQQYRTTSTLQLENNTSNMNHDNNDTTTNTTITPQPPTTTTNETMEKSSTIIDPEPIVISDQIHTTTTITNLISELQPIISKQTKSTHISNTATNTNTIKGLLSLPLSVWQDDKIWNHGRSIFFTHFQSHCSAAITTIETLSSSSSSDHHPLFDTSTTDTNSDITTISSIQSPLSDSYKNNNIQSPLSDSYKSNTSTDPVTLASSTINDVQETLNLLVHLSKQRTNTKLLHNLMNQLFAEIRATMELYKEAKIRNKQLRNDYQYHPSFVPDIGDVIPTKSGQRTTASHKLNNSSNYDSIYTTGDKSILSLGILAHMIELTIHHMIQCKYWHPDTTTAYQTMIQVAAMAIVDQKMYSVSTTRIPQAVSTTATSAIQNEQQQQYHNPGANAEYWLRQQLLASNINPKQQQQHTNDSSSSRIINAPNRYDYTTVMEGWVVTSKNEQLYQRFNNPYDMSQHPSIRQNKQRNDILDVSDSSNLTGDKPNNSISTSDTAADRAGQLIRQWQFLYTSSDNNPLLKPTEVAYACWLTCIANTATRSSKEAAMNAARECHNVLKEISKRSEKDSFWPGVALYNILMNVYAKAREPAAAEAVLLDLIDKAKYNSYCVPDAISFTTVINAWAQIPHNQIAPIRAEKLFNLQHDFAIHSGIESVYPTVATVTSVLQCWAKSNHPLAPTRADAILKQLYDMVKAGHAKLHPNVITYNICMNIWSRSGHVDASSKVEQLYQELLDQYRASNYAPQFKPDIVTYLARMTALERNKLLTPRGIAEKVEGILNELVGKSNNNTWEQTGLSPEENIKFGPPRPNAAIYNNVIRAFSHCGDAVAATKYLEQMIEDYIENKNYKAKPNRYVFNFVISAWARKLSLTGADTAEWWLKRMHQLSILHPTLRDIEPDAISYNSCLGSWVRFPHSRMIIYTDPNIEVALNDINENSMNTSSDDTSKVQQESNMQSSTEVSCPTVTAMERGLKLYNAMIRNNIRPDAYTYGALLKIISNQKQCNARTKYKQAVSIAEKITRDNIEMNAYIFGLLKKCGVRNTFNNNQHHNQRNTATMNHRMIPTAGGMDNINGTVTPKHEEVPIPSIGPIEADTDDAAQTV